MNTQTRHAVAAALLGTLLLGAAACSNQPSDSQDGGDAPGAQAEPAAAAEPGAAAAPEDEAEDVGPAGPATRPIKQVAKNVGTREHPVPIGREVVEGDWTITLGQPHDGWEEIRAEDPYSAPPEDGTEYWLVPVTLTYAGSNPAQPWLDLQFSFVSDNRGYSDWCAAAVPEDLMAVDDLYTDATVEANVCLQIPAGAEGLWSMSTVGGEPTFFTAEAR